MYSKKQKPFGYRMCGNRQYLTIKDFDFEFEKIVMVLKFYSGYVIIYR